MDGLTIMSIFEAAHHLEFFATRVHFSQIQPVNYSDLIGTSGVRLIELNQMPRFLLR